jgi:hypothetical protein
MAVENKIVTHNITSAAADKAPAGLFQGCAVKKLVFNFEIAAADSDGSVYRVGRISPQAIVTSVKILCDAITAGTDFGIGLYKTLDVGGAVANKDAFAAGVDLSSAITALTEKFAPSQADLGKNAYQLSGVSTYDANEVGAFDIAFTGDTVGSAAGTVSGMIEYIETVA